MENLNFLHQNQNTLRTVFRWLDSLLDDAMMRFMRTTITIDDDLTKQLREKAHQTGSPFKTIVNKAIRAGIGHIDKPRQRKAYRHKSYSLGYPPKADIDHALAIADNLESEELVCKLLLRI